jgi:hypothetical protein
MTQTLIGSLSFAPENPKVGDSVRITALGTDGKPVEASAAFVSIDGQPGTEHYVQFYRAGRRSVRVLALGPNGPESVTAELTVAPSDSEATTTDSTAPDAQRASPRFLQIGHMPMRPGVVGFGVGQKNVLNWNNNRRSALVSLPQMVLASEDSPAYIWNFGNGHTIRTKTPTAHYNFNAWLDPLQEFQRFDVSVISSGVTVTRTLTICNLYAKIKREAHRLHLPISVQGYAAVEKTGLMGKAVIRNLENGPVTLSQRRFLPLTPDRNTDVKPSNVETFHPPIVIPAMGSTMIVFTPNLSQVPIGSTGFSVLLGGVGPSGGQVRASAHFDVGASDWVGAEATFDSHRISFSAFPHLPLDVPHPAPSAPQVGADCDPNNLPDSVSVQFACQATTEQRTVQMPARFMNARKGDSVLAPGGVGLVGQLLTHVAVPQLYAHCGIMTHNYDEITHCTASDDRVQDYPVGSIPTAGPQPVDGFRPDVVQFGWPGAITQTVDHAVNGEPNDQDKFVDPESKKRFAIQDFNSSPEGATIAGNWTIIPPMVVKPDPMIETDDHRLRLHSVANLALSHVGKMHYRFYGFTDPTMQSPAPASAGWAGGTSPAVCSSFIWSMFKQAGFHLLSAGALALATDIRPDAAARGAKVAANTPDGLFLYGASERSDAAKWFYDQISDKVQTTIESKAGLLSGIVEGLTKIIPHVANEFLHAFVDDHVQTDDDHDDWKNTKDANAVSVDDIMFWNGPSSAAKGPYGYCEPLEYREPRQETATVYRWQSVAQRGALSGRVTYQGHPVAGGRVEIDGKSSGTDANGHYAVAGVAYGRYEALASETAGALYLSAKPIVNIAAPAATLDIALQPPPDVYRTIVIQGTLTTHYTYHNPIPFTHDKNERVSKNFFAQIDLGPDRPPPAPYVFQNNVDDAHATLTVTPVWQADLSLKVAFSLNLHDVTSSDSYIVLKDGTANWHASISAKNDDSQVVMTVVNKLKGG